MKSSERNTRLVFDFKHKKDGQRRCRMLYPIIGPCSECGNPKSERHHIDGNTGNNRPENIKTVCRNQMETREQLLRPANSMKTAQEWQHQWRFHLSCPNPEQIQEIQQDAYKSGLLRAAQVCRVSNPSGYSNWPIMRENLASAIEAEAEKGGQ